jgi:hypothetical protein
MKITAKGALRHRFHGDYSAVVALSFESATDADAAHRVLGAPWKRSERSPLPLIYGLVWVGDSAALAVLKVALTVAGIELTIDPCGYGHCKDKCKGAEIDGLAHSIDYGPRFTLTIECSDPNQVSLL